MTGDRTDGAGTRYHSLDSLRAAAMLLGVAWHAMPGFGSVAVPTFMDWLHSFRMPLFMLISGFFGHMMLEKYGLRHYLAKRWWRIGMPMLIGLFTFVPIYNWHGPMAGMFPGPGGLGGLRGFAGGPPPGPGGRPGGFGERPSPPPGIGLPANSLNRRLFGETGRLLSLGHLWFLWYLLVFITAAPVVSGLASWATARVQAATERLGGGLARYGLAPLVLGLVSLPCMMLIPTSMGWGLPLASGIRGQFPDFFLQYQPDWPFYFAYFMAGWWLYRERGNLPAVVRTWLPLLALGIATYVAARWFSAKYQPQTNLPRYEQLRVLGYGLFSVAAAYTSWGLLGLFQRFFDRPSRVGRYFSETALWIYLVHQDILRPVIRGLRPLGLSSYSQRQGLLATILAIAIAVGLYEVIIRPTPLVWVFGPGRPRSGRKAELEPSVPADEVVSEDGSAVIGSEQVAEREEVGQLR
jgi:fucose 4-O-acetylase-like acetyltransferase